MAELSGEIIEFLTAGTRTGMVGFVASDGRPWSLRCGSSSTTASWYSTPTATQRKAVHSTGIHAW